jgi:hypothetical protein
MFAACRLLPAVFRLLLPSDLPAVCSVPSSFCCLLSALCFVPYAIYHLPAVCLSLCRGKCSANLA